MSYTPPVTFVGGNTILADDINANNDALRKYINKDIIIADLATDTFGTTELVKGEFYNVVNDHQFTTGDMYTQAALDEDGNKRQYYSSTIKTRLSGQWGTNNQYQIVADTGKAIYFEASNGQDLSLNACANIIITGHIGVRNYEQYVFNSDYVSTNQETKFYLLWKIENSIDEWVPISHTKGQVLGFEVYANSALDDGSDTGNDRRVIPFLFHISLPNLWSTVSDQPMPQTLAWRFAIGVESSIDLGWINNRFMTYEVFYA